MYYNLHGYEGIKHYSLHMIMKALLYMDKLYVSFHGMRL